MVSALCGQGLAVRAVVRRDADAASLAAPGLETIIGDLLDEQTIRRAVRGIGGAYHLAGRLFTPGVEPEAYAQLHVGTTGRLLEACAASPDPIDFFVLCSTTGVHGDTGNRLPAEDDPTAPQNAYERTKLDAERVAATFAASAGIPLAIARPGLVYGPGDRHLLGWFRSIRGGYYRVIGAGGNRFHPIYIDDAAHGLMLISRHVSPASPAYHIVGPRPVTLRELSDAIGEAVGRPVPSRHLPVPLAMAAGAAFEMLPLPRRMLPLTRSRVRFMIQNRAYDGRRANGELGFVPRVDLREGMRKTVNWYRAQGWL